MKKRRFITQKSAPYIFCLPFIITFVIFLVYPMLNMIYTSVHKMQGVSTYQFVGMDNYYRLLSDSHILTAIANSIGFTVGIVIINTTVPLFLAVFTKQ